MITLALLLIGGGVALLVALGVGVLVLLKLGVIARYATQPEPPADEDRDFSLDQSHEPGGQAE